MKQTYIDSKSFYKQNRLYEFMEGIKCNSLELYPTCCGHQICLPDYSYGPVVRMEYLIHYVSHGKGSFCINDKIYDLTENQIFFIPPGIPHFYCSDCEDPWEYLWLGFAGEKAFDYTALTGLSLEEPVADLLVPGHFIKEIIGELLKARYFSMADELGRIGYVYQFLSYLSESHRISMTDTSRHNRLMDHYMVRALEYIQKNYRHMTVGSLSEYLEINRTYVHTLFKKNVLMSPQQYLIRYRLQLAAGLLNESQISIQEIAFSVGYKDAIAFTKAFKNGYGISPQKYRLEKQGGL